MNDPLVQYMEYAALWFIVFNVTKIGGIHWKMRRYGQWLANTLFVYVCTAIAWVELILIHVITIGVVALLIGFKWPALEVALRLLPLGVLIALPLMIVLNIIDQLIRRQIPARAVPMGDLSEQTVREQAMRETLSSYKAAIGALLLVPSVKSWVMRWSTGTTLAVAAILHLLCIPGALVFSISAVLSISGDYPGGPEPRTPTKRKAR